MRKILLAVAAVAAAFAAQSASAASDTPGSVYTLTNSANGNAVASFARDAKGALTYVGQFPTGGNGLGANLGSQGAIAVSDNGRTLYAVNAGSDTVSAFAVRPSGLELQFQFPSGGVRPISVATRGGLVYVLNGGSETVSGFGADGTPIPGSTRHLVGHGPAQIAFAPSGDELVVTDKATQSIDTFPLVDGVAQPAIASASAGATPFGFAFDQLGRLFVSEAAGSASSYSVDTAGAHVISGAVATHQGAPCWLVVSKNGQYAYTANAAAGTISGFAIAGDGSLSLLDPSGASAAGLTHPLDEVVSNDGRFLYVLNDGQHSIAGYRINADGSLTPLGSAGSLPAGTVGLAAS